MFVTSAFTGLGASVVGPALAAVRPVFLHRTTAYRGARSWDQPVFMVG